MFNVDRKALKKIEEMLQKAAPFGSVEIILQNNMITQVSFRHIEKCNFRTGEVEFKNTLETDASGHIVKRKEFGGGEHDE